jgi:hypothetical protein
VHPSNVIQAAAADEVHHIGQCACQGWIPYPEKPICLPALGRARAGRAAWTRCCTCRCRRRAGARTSCARSRAARRSRRASTWPASARARAPPASAAPIWPRSCARRPSRRSRRAARARSARALPASARARRRRARIVGSACAVTAGRGRRCTLPGLAAPPGPLARARRPSRRAQRALWAHPQATLWAAGHLSERPACPPQALGRVRTTCRSCLHAAPARMRTARQRQRRGGLHIQGRGAVDRAAAALRRRWRRRRAQAARRGRARRWCTRGTLTPRCAACSPAYPARCGPRGFGGASRVVDLLSQCHLIRPLFLFISSCRAMQVLRGRELCKHAGRGSLCGC